MSALPEDIGRAFADSDVAIVVGADARVGEMISVLPILACNAETRDTPIVLAAPRDALNQVAGEIPGWPGSTGWRCVRLALEPGSDIFDGLAAGANGDAERRRWCWFPARSCRSSDDWLSRMLAAYRERGQRCMVSPTILYEDGSLRWAGSWLEESDAGTRSLVTPSVGLPRIAVANLQPRETSTGTLECCVLPRAAIEAARGFAAGYLGAAAKNIDMALRIRLSGNGVVLASGRGDGRRRGSHRECGRHRARAAHRQLVPRPALVAGHHQSQPVSGQ